MHGLLVKILEVIIKTRNTSRIMSKCIRFHAINSFLSNNCFFCYLKIESETKKDELKFSLLDSIAGTGMLVLKSK